MSGDLIFSDKWLVMTGLGAAVVFIMNRVGASEFSDLLNALDRAIYTLL